MKNFRIILVALLMLSCQTQSIAAEDEKSFVISDIKVAGLQRVELGTFYTFLSVRVGETINAERIPSIIRSIYRSGSFDDVELMHDGTTMIINVAERPTIAHLTFDGNSAIKTEDLEQGLAANGLAQGEVLDSSLLSHISQDLEKQYFSYGKYSVKVKHQVVKLSRNRVDIK
ncbi:MAG: outer membrane protein assembly factor BamA, partial [Gammaproteobacteria bacterium]|nr:outer membrane protein assembly factor BamA [Gammaproteobacteria bacterium]